MNNEAAHSWQSHYSLRKIAIFWSFKIKNYRREPLATQCVPDSVKNQFSVVRKAAEDQNGFGSDCVNDIANTRQRRITNLEAKK